ncbi:MAG: hypothetical protein ABSE35_10600 [Bryobacteraceae bacterium]
MLRRNFMVFGVMALGFVASGSLARATKFTLDTAPVKQGRIFVDDKFLGVAPVTVDLKVSRGSIMKARAEKEGALGLWPTEFTKDQRQTVMIRLEEDEATNQTVASDIANKWLTIDPSSTGGANKVIDEGEAWKKIVSIVTDNFTDIEQLDRASFYLRSAWRVRRYTYSVVRNRLIVKRGVSSNLTIRVEIESQICRSADPLKSSLTIRDEMFTENPRVYPSDQDTVRILRDQF